MRGKAIALVMAGLASLGAGQSLIDALSGQPSLSNLTTYLNLYPDFKNQLESMSNITLLAPTNTAFMQLLNSSNGAAIQANDRSTIEAFFSYHVLNGTYQDFSSTPQFPTTLLTSPMYANLTGGQVVEAIGSGRGNSGNSTAVFYSGLLQNSSTVGKSTNFSEGVIHAVDRFLMIPENITETAIQLNLRAAVGALQVANMADSIDTMTDITCFIPDNAAFQRIASSLATATPQEISHILQYHTINGTVAYGTSLQNGTSLRTMEGANVTITIDKGEIYVNSARVSTPNVLVANGVVHVIDNVLNPANATAKPNPTASTQTPAFSSASSTGTNVPFTSGVPTPTSSINTEAPTSQASAAAPSASSTASASSSSSSGAAMPMNTGGVGTAALLGGAALLMNM